MTPVEVGEAAEDGLGETEHLAHLADGALAAVGDDVGGHGGTARGEAAVDLLDDGLAALAAGEVEVDVGPGLAALAEESFEQELVADRVAGGDAERVADGGVGCGAAPLDEDALLAGEVDDVPDDEEVAAEAELGDDAQLVVELVADFLAEFLTVAFAGAGVGHLAQVFCLAGDGESGELVAEILEVELEALGEVPGIVDRLWEIGEQGGHLLWGFEEALGVAAEERAGAIQQGVVAQAGEGIVERALVLPGEGRAVAGDDRELLGFGEFE